MSLLKALGCALASVQVSAQSWSMDGGGPYRAGAVGTTLDLNQQLNRKVFSYALHVDTGTSMIEDALLQSPLITSDGHIVLVTDDMDIAYMVDPATLAPTVSTWTPQWYFDNTGYAPIMFNGSVVENEDFVFAGMILDPQPGGDILYIVDSRNRLLRAMKLAGDGPTEMPNSPFYWDRSARFVFSETVSMLLVPDNNGVNQLWLPIRGSLLGSDGIAILFPTDYFSTNPGNVPYFVPAPRGCTFPEDYGTVAIPPSYSTGDKAGILILSAQSCGAVMFTADLPTRSTEQLWNTAPGTLSFNLDGEHPYPAYDTASNLMLFLDFSVRYGSPQQLCCTRTTDYGSCPGWRQDCFNVPAEAFDPEEETFSPWDWMALSVANGYVFVVASGYTTITAADTFSMLAVYRLSDRKLMGKHRFDTDMFSSAALIVTPGGNPENAQVYISTTKGGIYCYNAMTVSNGPLWNTYGEIGRVPDSGLPESTYAYLTVSTSGTIFVIAPINGDLWQTEKVAYAIVNGIRSVPGTTPPPSPAPPASNAGLVGGVVGGIGAALAVAGLFAYYKVPAFKSGVQGVAGKFFGGKSTYKSVGASSGGFSGGGSYGGAGGESNSFMGSSSSYNMT